MESLDPIIIVGAARTPVGRFQGDLAAVSAPHLGAVAIRAALERAGVAADRPQEVLMGCVLPAAQGQAPARQAARLAGMADAVGATTINKVCGSGMKAVMLAHDLIVSGSAGLVVAGGMESMSGAPYMLAKARSGYRVGASGKPGAVQAAVAALDLEALTLRPRPSFSATSRRCSEYDLATIG